MVHRFLFICILKRFLLGFFELFWTQFGFFRLFSTHHATIFGPKSINEPNQKEKNSAKIRQ
jgi:hypothetical protein